MRQYLSELQKGIVQQWWNALQPNAPGSDDSAAGPSGKDRGRFRFDRGPRARLRRAPTLTAIAAESATFELRGALGSLRSPRLNEHDAEWLPLVCGVLGHVETHAVADRSLAMAMGHSNDPVPVSEIRFRRLMIAEEPEDFFQQLRRVLRLATGGVNVPGLANDLLAWSDERAQQTRRADSMHYQWARDYYLTRKDQNADRANAKSTQTNPAQESRA